MNIALNKRYCISIFLLLVLPIFFVGCFEDVTSDDPGNGTDPDDWELSEEEDAFLNQLQEDTFDYFWETTNPDNGLAVDRSPDPTRYSIAATGFALSAYVVGVEKGYITRQEAAQRTYNTLEFLWTAPQGADAAGTIGFRGFFYRHLDLNTGMRFENSELSTMDTAVLMAGVLTAQTYFNGTSIIESDIRGLANSLFERVDWEWAYSQIESLLLTSGWRPDTGYSQTAWRGYNHAMLLYILAMGSQSNSIQASSWFRWTESYLLSSLYGWQHLQYESLMGHQLAHVWIDFRNIQDEYMRDVGTDYFENSRRATYAQREYAIDNPDNFNDYGENTWGLTLSDGPANVARDVDGESIEFRDEWERGISVNVVRDDGTIAPAAAGGSMPFAPEISIPALFNMYETYGDRIYGEYGFRDAFNPTFVFTDVEIEQNDEVDPEEGWVSGYHTGMNQGTIFLMTQNYRDGSLWDLMKANPKINLGLTRAGFRGGWLDSN